MNPLDIIKSQNIDEIKKIFIRPVFKADQAEAINQYKVAEHDINDKAIRPDKLVKKDTGRVDSEGNPITQETPIPVSRIGINFQKLIVGRRTGFMLSTPVETEVKFSGDSQKEKDFVDMVDRIQHDNKAYYRNMELARRLMSELECAEIWYFVETGEVKPKFTLKMKVLSPDLGDTLYPLFDNTGDMIAFARGYKLIENGKEIEHFDVYTADFEYKYVNRGSWVLDDSLVDALGKVLPNPIPNTVKKIMVVYYSQMEPEWYDEQSMIDRFEELTSNHADMNDYFGSPILAVSGDIMGFAQKGEQGKILQLAQEAKANYLALSSQPESFKMELDNLKSLILTMSHTPDISFEQMKGIGTISGVALKLLFLDAHMAVRSKEEVFGMGLQRRINIIKAAIAAVIDTSMSEPAKVISLTPKITPYLPSNTTELVSDLTVAVTGGIMSKETAVEQNPLVPDPLQEIERMKADTTNQIAGL